MKIIKPSILFKQKPMVDEWYACKIKHSGIVFCVKNIDVIYKLQPLGTLRQTNVNVFPGSSRMT